MDLLTALPLAQLPAAQAGSTESWILVAAGLMGTVVCFFTAINAIMAFVDRLQGKGSPGYVSKAEFDKQIERCVSSKDYDKDMGSLKEQLKGIDSKLDSKLGEMSKDSADYRKLISGQLQDVREDLATTNEATAFVRGWFSQAGVGLITIPTAGGKQSSQ